MWFCVLIVVPSVKSTFELPDVPVGLAKYPILVSDLLKICVLLLFISYMWPDSILNVTDPADPLQICANCSNSCSGSKPCLEESCV